MGLDDGNGTASPLHPRRIAIKFSPPTLIVEYDSNAARLQHYSICLKNLHRDMDAAKITRKLFARHPHYLDPKKVKQGQVESLLAKLISRANERVEIIRPCGIDAISAKLIDGQVDLNRCSVFQLQRAKALMDVEFERHQISPKDGNYVYDKQQDFPAPTDDSGSWDDACQ